MVDPKVRVVDIYQKQPEVMWLGEGYSLGIIINQKSKNTGVIINHTMVINNAQIIKIAEKSDEDTNLLPAPISIPNGDIDSSFIYNGKEGVLIPFFYDTNDPDYGGVGSFTITLQFYRDSIDTRIAVLFVDVKKPRNPF